LKRQSSESIVGTVLEKHLVVNGTQNTPYADHEHDHARFTCRPWVQKLFTFKANKTFKEIQLIQLSKRNTKSK